MKTYRLYQVDAFTTELFRGNPAGVMPDADGLTDFQMQAVARELNNSETAFILSPSAPDHDLWVRFFTPTTEVPSCGHATIAAHYVRAREKALPSGTVIQKIGVGILPVEIIREGEEYRIVMTQGAIEFGASFSGGEREEIITALGLTGVDLDPRCPCEVVSTGHSKVMVGIRERTTLNRLTPDMTRLTAISRRIGCNGYFVFTLVAEPGDVLSYGRMFAPAIGIPEDPVTGNANGPLGAYLVRHRLVPTTGKSLTFKGRQGEAIGRLGTVEVTVEIEAGRPKTVRVGGHAVIVFQTELRLLGAQAETRPAESIGQRTVEHDLTPAGAGWEISMNGVNRSDIKPGAHVKVVRKEDQASGRLTEGIVRDILTKSASHPHGIKVRLQSGIVGRVKEILDAVTSM